MREEKLEEQREAQEERLKRAMERAQADPKKRVSFHELSSLCQEQLLHGIAVKSCVTKLL